MDSDFVRDLDLNEWLAFVDDKADMPEATVKGRCAAGKHLLAFMKEEARKIQNFPNLTTNFIQTADIIMEKLTGRAKLNKGEDNDKKQRKAAQLAFIDEEKDAVKATGEQIQRITAAMIPKIWDLIHHLQEHPEDIPKHMHKLSQGGVYCIGLGNGQRPQGYAKATRADLYTFEFVPEGPGYPSFHQFTIGEMTPANLKTSNILGVYVNNTAANIIGAYFDIRAKYIEMMKVTKKDSDKAPFFLRGRGLEGLDLKNLRNLWPEAQQLNYRKLRDQNSTLQRLAGASAQVLGAHSEATVTSTYYTNIAKQRTIEMVKVMTYQESRGLQTAPDGDRMSEEETKRLAQQNLEEGKEFLRMVEEEKKVEKAAKAKLSTKQNRALMRLVLLNLVFGFKCPWLTESILLRPGLKYVETVRKELNVLG